MSSLLQTILTRLALRELFPLFTAQGIDDSLLAGLTDDDLQKIGIDKLGDRKKLLSAFAENPAAAPVVPSTDPLTATRTSPFVNSLGVPFLPIAGYKTLFSAWPVRVCDYQVFCDETSAAMPECDFAQASDHPVVNVSWHEATAYCKWLTKREHHLGTLKDIFIYRLPEDREWSAAVELLGEAGLTPAERSGKVSGYPWGGSYPPPRDAGNYHTALKTDDFRETSPVGSFPANRFGLHDLGGNVWEWCQDKYDRDSTRRVLRGASCFNDDDEYLLSSYRDKDTPDSRRNNRGFRLTLSVSLEKDPWFERISA